MYVTAALTTRMRRARVITGDATRLEYDALVEKDCDYLQIDIEPPLASLGVLLRMPLEKRRFAVVTFEHDDYGSPGIKQRSRQYLRSHGYVLVVGDIAPDRYNNFEDWWVHPELVGARILEKMRDTSEGAKRADDYMLARGSVQECS